MLAGNRSGNSQPDCCSPSTKRTQPKPIGPFIITYTSHGLRLRATFAATTAILK